MSLVTTVTSKEGAFVGFVTLMRERLPALAFPFFWRGLLVSGCVAGRGGAGDWFPPAAEAFCGAGEAEDEGVAEFFVAAFSAAGVFPYLPFAFRSLVRLPVNPVGVDGVSVEAAVTVGSRLLGGEAAVVVEVAVAAGRSERGATLAGSCLELE